MEDDEPFVVVAEDLAALAHRIKDDLPVSATVSSLGEGGGGGTDREKLER